MISRMQLAAHRTLKAAPPRAHSGHLCVVLGGEVSLGGPGEAPVSGHGVDGGHGCHGLPAPPFPAGHVAPRATLGGSGCHVGHLGSCGLGNELLGKDLVSSRELDDTTL